MRALEKNNKFSLSIFVALMTISLLGMISCNEDKKDSDDGQDDTVQNPNLLEISPISGTKFQIGDSVTLKFKPIEESTKIDSVHIIFNDKHLVSVDGAISEHTWYTNEETVGNHSFTFEIFTENKKTTQTHSLMLLSDIEPKKMSYKIVKTLEHNPKSYTQGLEFYQNNLFEGTGQFKESKLLKLNYLDDKVEKEIKLDDKYFGEGITIFNDKIYQITWKSRLGFIYDVNDLSLLKQFSYTSEGWGLTHDDKNLYMSDGTYFIYKLNPETMEEVSRVQACDNQRTYDNLNELEFVDGNIYANVYQTNSILKLEAKTGKVLEIIDLTNILPQSEVTQFTDVLNGIAYNPQDKLFYVTGKYWSKMYAVQFIEKTAN